MPMPMPMPPITLRCDVPGNSGFAQRFYRLRDAGEFLVVDFVLIRRSDPLPFREVEQHGRGGGGSGSTGAACWSSRISTPRAMQNTRGPGYRRWRRRSTWPSTS